jgi:hypothetical protein
MAYNFQRSYYSLPVVLSIVLTYFTGDADARRGGYGLGGLIDTDDIP